jgi:hypothetical protein
MLPIESDIRTQLIHEDRHREAAKERISLNRQREIKARRSPRFTNPFRSHQPVATPQIVV